MLYFVRYVHSKSKKMLIPLFNGLIDKIEENKGKSCLIIDDYILDKVLDKLKKIIGTEKCDDTKILIDTNNKFLDHISLKNVVILMTCFVK